MERPKCFSCGHTKSDGKVYEATDGSGGRRREGVVLVAKCGKCGNDLDVRFVGVGSPHEAEIRQALLALGE